MSEDFNLYFIYNGSNVIMQCNINEYMKDIFKRYSTKIENNKDDLFYLYNGDLISGDSKIKDIASQDKEMKIIVYSYEDDSKNKKSLVDSEDIICPECNEICQLNFENYKINLNNCKNGHSFS